MPHTLRAGSPCRSFGFGFLDNFVMLVAGAAIEDHLGLMLGLSTLAAAALGNLVSDVAGVGLGNAVEILCCKLGLPAPQLSNEQLRLSICRLIVVIASAVGIALGCVLGMLPLLWLDTERGLLRKAFDELDSDKSGTISWTELSVAMDRLGITVSQQDLETWFAKADINQDGVLDFNEFCKVVKEWKGRTTPTN